MPSDNGFVHAAVTAYNNHHHLVIRPDDVWLCILTQFSLYVNANAEELRHVFVAHEGKKELQVSAGGSRYTVNFGALAEQMTELIQKNVLDPSLREWILPDFTTTTVNDRVVSSVVMMATMKAYFDYKFSLMCGLPAVTLLGEKKDWEKLRAKIEKLPSFGEDTKQWYTLLKPVLTHFVAGFDQPESQGNKDFWQKIAHSEGGGSGPTYLSGWITAFCFFDDKGKTMWTKDGSEGLVLEGARFHRVDTGDIPPAYAEVDVLLDDNGQEFKTLMVAGLVGMAVTDSEVKRPDHSGKNDTIQPVSGWWIFDKINQK